MNMHDIGRSHILSWNLFEYSSEFVYTFHQFSSEVNKVNAKERNDVRSYVSPSTYFTLQTAQDTNCFWCGCASRVPVGSRIFSSSRRPDRFWGPSSLLSKGYRGLFQWVQRHGREANYSPSTSAEVKKTCIYTITPPWVFMAQYLIS
jgi:hypothetical protein